MDPIEKLSALFLKFPGIGRRQAKRFVYHLLTQDGRSVKELAEAITSIQKSVIKCSQCQRFFSSRTAQPASVCDICGSEQTDRSTIMIVERDVDLETIRKSGTYHGAYFVLGGMLTFLDKNPDESIRAKSIVEKISSDAKDGILKEIILALSATPEGEHTALYVKKILEPLGEKHHLKISLLGRGLSTGTELEYSDSDTLKNALKNRA